MNILLCAEDLLSLKWFPVLDNNLNFKEYFYVTEDKIENSGLGTMAF